MKRASWILRLAPAATGALLVLAAPASLHGKAVQRRDWWLSAPGGTYGLMEIRALPPALPASRTTVFVGPWRRTFDATAPQILAVIAIPTLVAAFTWGWIKTRRR
jgi:hypothetical protein